MQLNIEPSHDHSTPYSAYALSLEKNINLNYMPCVHFPVLHHHKYT